MLKIGVINYINANPLFYALKTGKVSYKASLTFGNPLHINNLFHKGEVDIALISSAEFLAHRHNYLLLSNLGVASTGSIISVRLFYKNDPLSLDENIVLVPSISTTSIRLLSCMSKYFWNVRPTFKRYSCSIDDLFKQTCPFLLIGDVCLKYMDRKEINSLDLGEAWHSSTSKSFIYSLVATRVDSFKQNPEEVFSFHNDLENSLKWAETHRSHIVADSYRSTLCSKDLLKKYFSTIEHRLTSKHFQGLSYFSNLEV